MRATIREAYQRRFDGYWSCLRAPLECDTSYLFPGGDADMAMNTTMRALWDRERAVSAEHDVGYHVIDSIEIQASGDEAVVVACWWSTAVLWGPPVDPTRPTGPENPPTIAADVPSGGRQADTFVHDGNDWRLESAVVLDDGFAEDPCTDGANRTDRAIDPRRAQRADVAGPGEAK